MLTASAKTGRHVERILVEAVGLADRSREPDPDAAAEPLPLRRGRQPASRRPASRRTRQPAPEAAVHDPDRDRPPRFSIQVNSRGLVTRDYAYFLENRLRERYRLEGIPLVIDFVERNERRGQPER